MTQQPCCFRIIDCYTQTKNPNVSPEMTKFGLFVFGGMSAKCKMQSAKLWEGSALTHYNYNWSVATLNFALFEFAGKKRTSADAPTFLL